MEDIKLGLMYMVVIISIISYALYFPTIIFRYLKKKYNIKEQETKTYKFVTITVWVFINTVIFATW